MKFAFSIIILITALLYTGFGFIAYLKNRQSLPNKSYGLLSLSFALWIFSWAGLLVLEENQSLALFLARMLSLGSIWIPVFYFQWVVSTLQVEKRYKYAVYLSYIFAVLFSFISFKPVFIRGVHSILFFTYWPTPGPLYAPFLLIMFAGFVGLGLLLLLKNLSSKLGIARNQILYMLLGSAVGFGGGATNFVFMYRLSALSNPLTLFVGGLALMMSPIIFTYAVVKYRFMNIRLLLSRSFLYFLLVAVVTTVFAFTSFLIARYWQVESRTGEILILMAVSSVLVLGLDPLKRMLAKITDDIFYKDKVDYQALLNQTSIIIAREIDLQILLNSLSEELSNGLKVETVSLLTENDGKYTSSKHAGENFAFLKNGPVTRYLEENPRPIIVDELFRVISDERNSEVKKQKESVYLPLDQMGVEFIAPVFLEGEIKALIVLGPKQSGDIYTDEDVRFFSGLAPQIAVALEKSQLYESIGEFNLQLQDKINRATQELKETNVKLQEANAHLTQLDKAKSEFLSIASHQLRTPISAIKGYLSMLLEGDFGKIPEKQKSVIKDLFESSSRLARLINIFLNVSRIESGRFKLDRTMVNINDLVNGVITELTGQAQSKGLTLVFKPDKKMPAVFIDSDKIREVILNLVDNAIKYTRKGEIKIEAQYADGILMFSTKDHGVGIRPEEVKTLFRKFVRGTGIAQVNTTGSGLGLYIAQRVITEHGGKIWAESPGLDKGSTFMFTIPASTEPTENNTKAEK